MESPSAATVLSAHSRTAYAVLLSAAAFLIPFLVSGPQWLTGTAVNCLLILAADVLPGRFVWPVILLPSIGTLAHGALFGPFTPFLLFFVPFIWTGNWLFTALFARIRPVSPPLGMSVGAFIKAAFLSLSALALLRFGLVPELFVTAMSLIQFLTALAGGALALVILRFLQKTHE